MSEQLRLSDQHGALSKNNEPAEPIGTCQCQKRKEHGDTRALCACVALEKEQCGKSEKRHGARCGAIVSGSGRTTSMNISCFEIRLVA